jgi:hypothetical protein
VFFVPSWLISTGVVSFVSSWLDSHS